jgi:hypothetical protein
VNFFLVCFPCANKLFLIPAMKRRGLFSYSKIIREKLFGSLHVCKRIEREEALFCLFVANEKKEKELHTLGLYLKRGSVSFFQCGFGGGGGL